MVRIYPVSNTERKRSNSKTLWNVVVEELQQSGPRTRQLEEYKHKKFIIFPDDYLYECWGIIISLLLLYTCTVTPFRICLIDIDTTNWLYADLAIDILFFIDLIINCFLAYYDKEVNLVISNFQIFKNYATGWMLIDFLSCFPLQFILQNQKNYSNLLRFGRISKIYKLAKIFKLIRILKLVNNKNQLMRYMTSIFRVNIALERLMWFLVTFLMLVHLLACLWIFIGRFNMDTSDQNWIFQSKFVNFDSLQLYITGTYWATTTLTTVGYGDIHAYNLTERIFACFTMIIGIFLYSYIIGSLTNLLSNLDLREAKLTRKLDIVNRLHREYPKISKNFYKKITTALEYKHKNTKSNIDSLLADLPIMLRSRLLIVIYQKELQSNVFFERKKTDFVAFIAPLLKPVRIEAGDYIFKAGELACEMYFIISGEIQMTVFYEGKQKSDVSENRIGKEQEIPFNTLIQGYFFGETDLLFAENRERTFNAKACKKAELLALSKEGFESMLKTFEEESMEIMSMAYDRNLRLKENLNKAIETFENNSVIVRQVSFPNYQDTDSTNVATTRINVIPPEMQDGSEGKSKNMYDAFIEEKLGKVESDIVWAKRKLKDLKENILEAKEVLGKVCEALE